MIVLVACSALIVVEGNYLVDVLPFSEETEPPAPRPPTAAWCSRTARRASRIRSAESRSNSGSTPLDVREQRRVVCVDHHPMGDLLGGSASGSPTASSRLSHGRHDRTHLLRTLGPERSATTTGEARHRHDRLDQVKVVGPREARRSSPMYCLPANHSRRVCSRSSPPPLNRPSRRTPRSFRRFSVSRIFRWFVR